MRKIHAVLTAFATFVMALPATVSIAHAEAVATRNQLLSQPSIRTSANTSAAKAATFEGLQVADIAIALSQDGRTVTVSVTATAPVPNASIRVTFYHGGQASSLGTLSLGQLADKQSVQRSLALPSPPAGDSGIVAQVFRGSEAADSRFMAVRSGTHGIVTAGSFDALAEAELQRERELGRLSEGEFRTRVLKLHEVPSSGPSTIKVTPRDGGKEPSAAAAGVTISGKITYHDFSNTQRGVRNALLELVQANGPLVLSLGRTTDAGDFNATIADFSAGDYKLKITADNGAGLIEWASLRPYYVTSGSYRWSPGNAYSGVDVDIVNNNDVGRAFALLDALRTASAYYQRIRQASWKPQLRVDYPATGSRSSDGRISISGSSVICPDTGTNCNEDAFDWTVLAHESGHVVANEGGFASSPGGSHNICANAWQGGTSKQDANALAFSEGWATFYGQVALQEQGVPSGIPNYSPTRYFDGPLTPPNPAGNPFFYDIETASAATGPGSETCTPEGEDSELAVQRTLWDLYDTHADADSGETAAWGALAGILGTLVSSSPSSLSAAYQALSSGRSWPDRKAGQKVLAAHGIGPTIKISNNYPPTINWGNGGNGKPGGPPTHNNNSFDVQYVDPATGTVVKTVAAGSAQTYTPTPDVWNQIINGRSSLEVQVAGRQTDSPGSGPYLSPPSALSVVGLSVRSATSWDNLWQNYGDKGGDWNGGDGVQSTKLPDGSTAWFYNDSFWGNVSPDGTRPLFLNTKPRNMVVVQKGTGSTLKSFGGPADPFLNPLNLPGTLVASPAPYNNQSRYHIFGGDGIMVGDTLHKFYVIMDGQGGNVAFPDLPVGNALATFTWDGSKLTASPAQTLGVPWTGVQWGIAALNEGGHTYIYGDEDVAGPPVAKYLHLARVPQGSITDWGKWEYWTGSSWSSSASASIRMMPGVSNGFSVTKINGKYVLLTNDSNGNQPWSAVAYYADQPWEFTSTLPKNTIYTPPAKPGQIQYEYRIHPQFSNGSRVLVGYSTNTLRLDNACMGENDYDARIYRPRFLDVQLPGLPGSSGALPTTGAPAPTPYPNTPPVPPAEQTWHMVDSAYSASHCNPSSPAAAPAPALTATPTANTGVALKWTISPAAMWIYLVQYHDDTADPNWNNPPAGDPNCKQAASQGGWCQMVYPINGLRAFTMENLTAYHKYRFRVAAGPWRSGGTTWSSAVQATPVIPPPTGTPANVTATPGRGSVKVTWTDNNPNVWFRIIRSDGTTVLKTDPTPNKSFTWYTSLEGDPEHPREYEFWIVESNQGGDGPDSAHVRVKPLPCGLLVGVACDQP
ncbi:DUF5005 domain-containing protein [Streptosporangium sp. NPDC000396]|uniref:DUF5005 domain-containing protein n=1 Tax=Streptosporangium sp. NPDC000396 TaxID=3366185 RepID=UPI00367AC930